MKKILIVAAAVIFFASCGNGGNKKAEVKVKDAVEASAHIVKVSPDNFLEKAAGLVGENVEIVGTVDHTCKHGGKKMVIFGENADNMVKLLAGEGIDKFDNELEGQKVIAMGQVEEMRIDEDYLQKWEKEAKDHHGDNEEEIGRAHV